MQEVYPLLDEARTHCSEGSGLGLAIVKRIVMDHQGSIYAKNSGGLEICMEFSDGCEAVMQFRKRKYAAVLLDLMLPGKSGFDICREIRAQSDVPILLVTAKKRRY